MLVGLSKIFQSVFLSCFLFVLSDFFICFDRFILKIKKI
jgi:hypothetical protein